MSEIEKKVYNLEEHDLSQSLSGRAFIRSRNSDALSSFGDFIAVSGIIECYMRKIN